MLSVALVAAIGTGACSHPKEQRPIYAERPSVAAPAKSQPPEHQVVPEASHPAPAAPVVTHAPVEEGHSGKAATVPEPSQPIAKPSREQAMKSFRRKATVDFSDVQLEAELVRPEGQYASPAARALKGDSGGLGVGSLGARGSGTGGGSVGGLSSYGAGGAAMVGRGSVSMKQITIVAPDAVSNSEGYRNYGVNAFTETAKDHLSTFSVDVDTASYAISRRKILEGVKPPPDSVRVEEYLNYFRYSYASPKDGPLAAQLDAAPSPFDKGRYFLRVGVQGKTLGLSERKPAHLTFLVDVSGSMQSPDKLPLAKKALRILVDNLRDGDTVALVTYAGAVRDVLPPTGMEQKAKIHAAIEDLTAGGSTAMASGLDLAYRHAAEKLGPSSNSRVIILSDGDANVGPTNQEEIRKIIAKHVKEGVTLSVVGFGMGNYKDDLMEQLADKGNGNYFYVDTIMQAKRVFQEQLGGTLEVIAKDVKLQVDFDPSLVKRYRLVGYENRDIADKDFRNDKVDAGEIGSGHTVTALYEVELVDGAASKSFATLRVRAKPPKGEVAAESAFPLKPENVTSSFEAASKDLRFAVAVAASAEIFRESPWAKEWSLAKAEQIAKQASEPGNAERQEFLALIHRAQSIYTKVAIR
jgi:Ca-activated chloride channel family protein